MNVNDLAASAEKLFETAAGEAVNDKVKKNVSDVATLTSVALNLFGRNTEIEAEAVIDGASKVLDGIEEILSALKGKSATTDTSTSQSDTSGQIVTQ